MRTWLIGSAADCDIVVAQPKVSRRHCRLTETTDGYALEDLGSSNGTYVNGERITSVTHVSTHDAITLGASVPMPWPASSAHAGARIVRIGRDADNDIVLDDPGVSGRHARLIISDSHTLIEDLGSANGTFVNSPDQSAARAIPLTETDIVSFGSLTIPAKRLLSAEPAPRNEIAGLSVEERASTPARNVTVIVHTRRAIKLWMLAVLAQSPIIAALIVVLFGRHAIGEPSAENWTALGDAIADTTFALGLAAIWLGGSLAAWAAAFGQLTAFAGETAKRAQDAQVGSRLLILLAICIGLSVVLLGVVSVGSGLQASWWGMLLILVLAAAVGLLLGLFAFAAAPNSSWASSALLLGFVTMVALGGRLWPLRTMNHVSRIVSSIMPTRWAFEGLLELESDARTRRLLSRGAQAVPRDIVEPFFSAEAERMGPEADSIALAATLISVASLAATVFAASRPVPRSVASGG